MVKKILFVTNSHSVFSEPLQAAFKAHGCEIYISDYRGNAVLTPGKFIHRVVAKFPRLCKQGILNLAQWHSDYKTLAEAKAFKPDLIFVVKGKDIHRSILKKLRSITRTANYYPETFDHWERIQDLASQYDYFFNYDSEVVNKLKEQGRAGAYYIPFAADLDKNAKEPDFTGRKYNISFVGSFMPIRYTQRETILAQVKDLGVNVWGNKAWLETSLKDYYHGRPSTEEMLNIYRQSKIVVNIDLMQGVAGSGVNLRPFEITAAGALLMNHDDRKDIFNLFEEGKEFISFKGPEDIRSKVEYYLSHEEERSRLARAGFVRTQKTHTYTDSVDVILAVINHAYTS